MKVKALQEIITYKRVIWQQKNISLQ